MFSNNDDEDDDVDDDEKENNFQGTDQSYVDKLNANFGKNPYYGKSPRSNNPVFSISHYAGKVSC